MANYVFVMEVPDIDHTVEYRTDAPDHETAIDRAYTKYPEGSIERVASHNARGWDTSPPEPEDDGDDAADSNEEFDPTDHSVADIRDTVGDLSDEQVERALAIEENADSPRSTAIEALEEAL